MFKVNWRLIGFLLLLVSAIIGMLVLIVLVLPNNSYVHQGDNISQGNYYDLHGVYGFSGEVASWIGIAGLVWAAGIVLVRDFKWRR